MAAHVVASGILLLTIVVTAIGLAGTAGAGCDPRYGCQPSTTIFVPPQTEATTTTTNGPTTTTTGGPTTTTAPPGSNTTPQCVVSSGRATPGTRIDATVTNVPPGINVDLRLNGSTVDSETAGAPSGAVVGAATAAAAPGLTDVQFSFVVPDLGPGKYVLEAVGPAFRCGCLDETGGFEVLAAGATQGGGTGTNGTGGSLVRTGFTIGGFLLVAVVLILVGRVVLEGSRRTRSAAATTSGRHARRSAD